MIMSQSEEVQTKVVECAVLGPRGSHSHGEGRGGKRVGDDLRHGRSVLSAHMCRRAQDCWRARRQQSYSACVGERGARGHRPLAIDAAPPARALLPRMAGDFSAIAVVVNPISTALRGQSAPAERTVKYRSRPRGIRRDPRCKLVAQKRFQRSECVDRTRQWRND